MEVLFRALHTVGYDGWVPFEDFSTEKLLEERPRENLVYVKPITGRAVRAPSISTASFKA